tara:strand:+ start:8530 stop:12558 length:4029 start_codon:yes stop_codon:yes gene_type:complete
MRRGSVVACVLFLLASCGPLVGIVSADSSVLLDLDRDLVVLTPGQSTNVTLTVENNDTSIHDFTVSLGSSSAGSEWTVNLTQTSINQVFPYASDSIEIVISLNGSPSSSASGTQWIVVNRSGASSSVEIHLSVGAMYLPDIDATGIGNNGLFHSEVNSTINLPIEISNFGSVQDTILLSVGSEPDIAAFWANQSSGNSSNNSDNNDDSGNSSGGNNSGGNNSGGSNTTSINNLLMYGNSYTSQNSLHTILEDLGVTDAEALTGGGLRFDDHWNNVNTSGHSWNSTLRNTNWDYVVLQDQSQVPGFNRSTTSWIEDKDAAILLANEIESESSESVLMMTWGRRNGDVTNPTIYSNFTMMQDRLEDGYIDFRDNMTVQGRDVWIAPVGLAFKHIHDSIQNSGSNPISSTSTFYGLYSADGSHPSLSGSYLAACVIYATLTGETPVGSNDSVSLSNSLKLELQQAAAATVFNETSHLSYPWENSSTSGTSIPRSIPSQGLDASSWSVTWEDPVVRNLSSGSSTFVNLSIEIPNNAAPGPYGFRLHAASALGNNSVSTVMVVDVNGTHLYESNFSSDSTWIPGVSGNLTLTLTDVGTDGISPSISPGSISSTGACLVDSVESIDTSASASWLFEMDILSSAHEGDICHLSLSIHEAEGDITSVLTHSFVIGEHLSVAIEMPSTITMIEPGESSTVDVMLSNTGTEDLTVSASSSIVDGLSISIQDTEVKRGASEIMSVSISADSDISIVGLASMNLTFSVNLTGVELSIDGNETNNGHIDLDISPWSSLRIVAPQTNGITIEPGSTTSFSFDVENQGTQSVDASLVWTSVPAGVSVSTLNGSISLSIGEITTISVLFESEQSAVAINSPVNFELVSTIDGETFDSINASISITPRGIPSLSSGSTQLSILSSLWSTVDFTIANTGNSAGVFEIVVTESPSGVQVVLSESAFSLDSGSTASFEVQVKGDGIGILSLMASSTTGPSFNSTESLEIVQGSLAPQVTLSPSVVNLQHEETITFSGYIFNPTDSSGEYALEVLSSLDCALAATSITVPSGSSIEVLISCDSTSSNLAGSHQVTLVARPVDLPSISSSSSSDVTLIESVGPNGALLLDIELVEDGGLIIDKEGSLTMVVRVENTGNSHKKGILILSGQGLNSGLVKTWNVQPTGSTLPSYDIAPGEAVTMSLTLTNNGIESGLYDLTITASEDDGAGTVSIPPIQIFVQDDPVPPSGISFPTGHSINNSTSLSLMFGGYVFALLAVLALRWTMRRSNASIEAIQLAAAEAAEVEEPEPEEEEDPLAEGEVRASSDGSAICPFCSTRSKLPKDKTPPFRFRCPSCSEIVRVVE